MYWTYLRRELVGRKKQTIIVAAGLAIAIALVIIVNSLAAGVRDAQAQALESVYGVGTDLTVTGAMAEPGQGGGPQFEFDEDGGETTDDGTTSLSQSRLDDRPDAGHARLCCPRHGRRHRRGRCGLRRTEPDQHDLLGRAARSPVPRPRRRPHAESGTRRHRRRRAAASAAAPSTSTAFSVLGIDPAETAVGPLSAVTLSDGRGARCRRHRRERRRSGCHVRAPAATSPWATRSTSAAPTWRSSASSPRPRARPTPRRTSTSRWMSRRRSPAPETSSRPSTCRRSPPM